MRSTSPVRVLLAALLVLFSAPAVAFADAVLFHGGAATPLGMAVQAPDAPAAHGDSCQLASHQGHATTEATLAIVAGHPFLVAVWAPAPAHLLSSYRPELPSARAPPPA